MTERFDDGAQQPLPREWLPEPQPPEGDARWEALTLRMLDAARFELERLERRAAAPDSTAWSVMARWWLPAAALAAAASALLLVADRPGGAPTPIPNATLLELLASDGDPATLWAAAGIPADPVLARIALHGPPLPGTRGASGTTEVEEVR